MEVPWKDHYEMQQICLDMGSYLVELNTIEEHTTLRPHVIGKMMLKLNIWDSFWKFWGKLHVLNFVNLNWIENNSKS